MKVIEMIFRKNRIFVTLFCECNDGNHQQHIQNP